MLRLVALGWQAPLGTDATGGTYMAWVSDDGVTWAVHDVEQTALGRDAHGIVGSASGFLAWGAQPSEPARAWWSPDGREWVATDVPGGFALVGVHTGSGGVFAIGARECSRCVDPFLTWGSPDGRTWQPLGDLSGIHPIVASSGSRIAIFDWQGDRSISVSSDGLTWTKLARVPAAEHDAGVIVGSTGVLLLMDRWTTGADGVQDVRQGVLFLKGS